ncbi:MAG: hypothetical protein ACFFCE_06590 [Promethearchaeota archaeon]
MEIYEFNSSSIYLPRDRNTNIETIKSILNAPNEAIYLQARKQFGENYHPSLFAEFDYLERIISGDENHIYYNNRSDIHNLNSDLYLENLNKIISLRIKEIPEDKEELALEVTENLDFYQFITYDEPDLLKLLSKEQSEIISNLLKIKREEKDYIDLLQKKAHNYKEIQAKVFESLKKIKDCQRIHQVISIFLINSVLIQLDKLTSRLRTSNFVYKENITHSSILPIKDLNTEQDLGDLKDNLKQLMNKALGWRLGLLFMVCDTCLKFLDDVPVLELKEFEGSYAVGLGPCGNCSMMFASTSLISLDSTCHFLYSMGEDWLTIPLFNYISCPFCGYSARLETPVMFHSFKRNQTIYCFPSSLRGKSPEQLNDFKGFFESVRNSYTIRLSTKEVKNFKKSIELVTFGWSEFVYAIQMGNLDKQAHTTLINRYSPSNRYFILDPTNKISIELAPEEIDKYDTCEPKFEKSEIIKNFIKIESVDEAIELYNSGQLLKSKEILENLLKQGGDNYVKYNLGTVLYALGEEEKARKIFSELKEIGWTPYWQI